MAKLDSFLTADRDTLISCNWKVEKAIYQAQALIIRVLELYIKLNLESGNSAHQGQGPGQE